MEEVNIFSTNQNNRPIAGWLPPKVNSGIVSPGFISVANALGTAFNPVIGGTVISAASYTPQIVTGPYQNWLVNNQVGVFELVTWQRDLNIYTVSDFVGEFALKYQLTDPGKIYDFLYENEFLTSMVRQAIRKIEDYFQNHIKNLHLRIQSDPEDYESYQTLILEVESTESIKKAFELLTNFQKEWLVPNFGSKISHFSVDII